MKKNKKGFELSIEKLVKLALAVIVIFLLFYVVRYILKTGNVFLGMFD